MASILNRLKSSLLGKLMAMFVAAGLAISITIATLVIYWDDQLFREHIIPGIAHHISLSTKLENGKPNIERAHEFSEYMKLDTHIIGNKFHWSHSGNPLLPEVLTAKYRPVPGSDLYPPIPKQLSYAKLENNDADSDFVIRWEAEGYTFYFIEPDAYETFGFQGFYKSLTVALLVIILIFVLFYWFTRRQYAPIKDLKTSIQKYAEGNLEQRIHLDRQDELGDLGKHINHMADEIQSMLEAKQQLLLAISHELRTPVTRAHISAAMLEDTPLKTDIQDDLREMEKLVSDLLEGERLNTQHKALNLSVVSINDLVSEVASYFDQMSLTTKLLDEDIYIELDSVRIQLMLKNLVTNAIKYSNGVGSNVKICLALRDTELLISVSDQGEGIEEKHLSKLTEPFYRVDESRQRQSGGYGLGLYICRLIIEAHSGELHIDSEFGVGTTVTAKLPLPK